MSVIETSCEEGFENVKCVKLLKTPCIISTEVGGYSVNHDTRRGHFYMNHEI